MQDWGIPSVLLELDISISTSSSSDYGSYAFATKANMKTLAVLHVLQCNYNPLLSDVDVVYFKNPFDYLGTGNWDIQIQREESADSARERNSGFMYLPHFAVYRSYVSNTPRSNSLFNQAWRNHLENRSMRHQVALSLAIDTMLHSNLRMLLLPLNQFSPGWYFFEETHHVFSSDLPCSDSQSAFPQAIRA